MKKNWHQYFMDIATSVATRATCDRAHVGAVLVKNKRILSVGYNGAPAGAPECDTVGHQMVDGHCRRVIHSELNAIINAARVGAAVEGATCYCTLEPCYECTKALINAGVTTIIYDKPYNRTDNFLTDGVYLKTTDQLVFELVRALHVPHFTVKSSSVSMGVAFTTLHNITTLSEAGKSATVIAVPETEVEAMLEP